jgi:hypothetical protein
LQIDVREFAQKSLNFDGWEEGATYEQWTGLRGWRRNVPGCWCRLVWSLRLRRNRRMVAAPILCQFEQWP